MKLIADSGSTKTDWCLVPQTPEDGRPLAVHTQGINPFHQSEEAIASILRQELLPQLAAAGCRSVSEVFFYGSGCREELKPVLRSLFAATFPALSQCQVEGDLLGAARALCGRGEGVACILGTGSNSCLYDGERILQNTPPLGYVLGDEGGGAVLGVRFVNALYKGLLPASLRAAFEQDSGLTEAIIINKVYREPLPNRFLASLSVYIHRYLDCQPVADIVIDNFRRFFRRNLVQYGRLELPVSAVGSIACHYREQLEQAARQEGFVLGRVLKSPMEGLLAYHQEP